MQEALDELLRLGLESTNWNSIRAGGYLGAFTHDGFAPPVIAALALELERAAPRVFERHTLLMFWGFKHDTTENRPYKGIQAHADSAAVNLNLWVTPDEANLDHPANGGGGNGGGLVIYDKLASHAKSADFRSYNSIEVDASSPGLKGEMAIASRVPYRQNRAVLFTSALYHATDTVRFKPGFESCRINYTLLFGFMEAVRCPRVLVASPSSSSRSSIASSTCDRPRDDAEPTQLA